MPSKDFKAMNPEDWHRLNVDFESNMAEAQDILQPPNSNVYVDARLRQMNSCLQKSISSCVPNKKRLNDIKRATSDTIYKKALRKKSRKIQFHHGI